LAGLFLERRSLPKRLLASAASGGCQPRFSIIGRRERSERLAEGTPTALRDILCDQPKSEIAKKAFAQLAALCSGDSSSGRDPDCTGSITADSVSDPPSGEQSNPSRIY
jgi:hypothetical protein